MKEPRKTEFDSLIKIVEQLEKCNFSCEAGSLKDNSAFKALKKMAIRETKWKYSQRTIIRAVTVDIS